MESIPYVPPGVEDLGPTIHTIAHATAWRASDGVVLSCRDMKAFTPEQARSLSVLLHQLAGQWRPHMDEHPLPLTGPLEIDPTDAVRQASGPVAAWVESANTSERALARAHLDAAVDGLPLGAWDRTIIDWLAAKGTPVVATIASLIWRGRRAGADERDSLRASLDRLQADLAWATRGKEVCTAVIRSIVQAAAVADAALADDTTGRQAVAERLISEIHEITRGIR